MQRNSQNIPKIEFLNADGDFWKKSTAVEKELATMYNRSIFMSCNVR